MITSLFVIPWKGSEPTGVPRRGQRPALLVRDFIGDAENALVRVAVERFDAAPAEFSPLVLQGPTGTGKTHLSLLLAARMPHSPVASAPADVVPVESKATESKANESRANESRAQPSSRPGSTRSTTDRLHATHRANATFWSSGVDFVRQVGHAIDADSLTDLRGRILSAPAIVIDGLDRIAGRTAAEAELRALLDACLPLQKPMIVTSPALPLELPELAPSLASRLHAGLVVPLHPPGPAARQQLLVEFAARLRFDLPAEITRRAHDQLQTAGDLRPTATELFEFVRQLARLDAAAEERGDSTAQRLAILRGCVDEYVAGWGARPNLSLRVVSQAVADYFGIRPGELKGPSRRQMVVRARGVAIYLGRRLVGESLDRLGEHFGGRDHTTALHAVRKTEELLHDDPTLRKAVDDLLQRLQNA